MDFLDLKNLTTKTLIVFSTDNGPEASEQMCGIVGPTNITQEMMVFVNAVGSAGP